MWNAKGAAFGPPLLHAGKGRGRRRPRPDQSIALKLKAEPSLIPLGQREVTVLVRV